MYHTNLQLSIVAAYLFFTLAQRRVRRNAHDQEDVDIITRNSAD